MKRYIDLFKQQLNQNKDLLYLQRAKKIGVILLAILGSISVIEGAIFFYVSQDIQEKETLKNRYNSFIIQNQVFDSKINYFAFKYDLLKQYLNQDTNASFYYGLLDAFITEINSEALISSFSLDNELTVSFSLRFESYDTAIHFMSRIESEKLPDYFEGLTLKEFSISSQSTEVYILEFEGTFKKVTNAA